MFFTVSAKNRFLHFQGAGRSREEALSGSREEEAGRRKQGGGGSREEEAGRREQEGGREVP